MSRATITEGGAGHAGLVTELHRAASGERWSAKSVARLLALPGAFVLLADGGEGAHPAGVILCLPGGDGLEIAALGVLPAARGRGLGRALVESAIDRARGAGVPCMMLEVRADNEAARRLYESAGFTVSGRRKGYYRARMNRPAADALLMRRDL